MKAKKKRTQKTDKIFTDVPKAQLKTSLLRIGTAKQTVVKAREGLQKAIQTSVRELHKAGLTYSQIAELTGYSHAHIFQHR